MIKKLLAIDLTAPRDIVARQLGYPHFSAQPVRELLAGDGVDFIETYVTLVERSADDTA